MRFRERIACPIVAETQNITPAQRFFSVLICHLISAQNRFDFRSDGLRQALVCFYPEIIYRFFQIVNLQKCQI